MTKKKNGGALKNRLQKSYQDKDKGGAGQPALDWKKVENEVVFFKVKEGKNRINIIPYRIKTKNHPLVKTGDAKVGDLDYLLDVFIHRGVGPSQTDVICPKRNFGKPCPICEQSEEYKTKGKKKESDQLKAKRTVFYNVQDVRNPDKGLQVFTVSHYLFERELIDEARSTSDDGDIIDFPDIEDGKVVVFRTAEANFEGREYFEFKSFQFLDREDSLDDSLIDEAISFDEIMKLPSYDEVTKILYGEDEGETSDDDDDDPKPSKAKSKPKDDDDDDDDDEEPPVSKKGKKKEPEPEDDEEEEPEDDDEPPVPKKGKKKEPEPEDDDEPPAPKAKTKTPAKGACPDGFEYGKDHDTKDECEKCEVWEECLKEKNKLKGKASKK